MQQRTKPFIIVVGTDLSECSELAVESAFREAAQRELAEVHIVYVVELYKVDSEIVPPHYLRGSPLLSLDEPMARLEQYANRKLAEFAKQQSAQLGKMFSRAVTHVRADSPPEQIAQLASDLEADLVIVGTHGRRGFSRFLLGSVAEAVVRLAPCPVLVVRPKGELPIPKIEPPCPQCVETRIATNGAELWCEQHREHHARRHTYHQTDRVGAETNFPLVSHS